MCLRGGAKGRGRLTWRGGVTNTLMATMRELEQGCCAGHSIRFGISSKIEKPFVVSGILFKIALASASFKRDKVLKVDDCAN